MELGRSINNYIGERIVKINWNCVAIACVLVALAQGGYQRLQLEIHAAPSRCVNLLLEEVRKSKTGKDMLADAISDGVVTMSEADAVSRAINRGN